MPETLPINCPHCGGAMTLQFRDWPATPRSGGPGAAAERIDLKPARWNCLYCEQENCGEFAGRLAWATKTPQSTSIPITGMPPVTDMPNAEIILAVSQWQADRQVNPLTCGNDSRHRNLEPLELDGKVLLACLDCSYRQTFIPDDVKLARLERRRSDHRL